MALVSRNERIVLLLAGALAVGFPVALLPEWHAVPARGRSVAPVPVQPDAARPALGAAYERPLFSNGAGEAGETPTDAPQLAGIVGRLGDDAVALVRTSDGTTRALRIGESVDGWRLVSLAIDAAFFARGSQRVRVPLPMG